MAAGQWPTDIAPISTANVDEDNDDTAGLDSARADIEKLFIRFNDVLDSMGSDSVPYTNQNSESLMLKVGGATNGQVPIFTGAAAEKGLADSGYPITTNASLPNGNLALTDAIKAYVAAQTPSTSLTYYTETSIAHLSFSGSQSAPTTIVTFTDIEIPTSGQVTIIPEQIRINAQADGLSPRLGLQQGSTEWYTHYSNNGSNVYVGNAFNAVAGSATDEFYGSYGGQANPAIPFSIIGTKSYISGTDFPTGTVTLDVGIYDVNGFSSGDIEGDVLETRITLIVESFV